MAERTVEKFERRVRVLDDRLQHLQHSTALARQLPPRTRMYNRRETQKSPPPPPPRKTYAVFEFVFEVFDVGAFDVLV